MNQAFASKTAHLHYTITYSFKHSTLEQVFALALMSRSCDV